VIRIEEEPKMSIEEKSRIALDRLKGEFVVSFEGIRTSIYRAIDSEISDNDRDKYDSLYISGDIDENLSITEASIKYTHLCLAHLFDNPIDMDSLEIEPEDYIVENILPLVFEYDGSEYEADEDVEKEIEIPDRPDTLSYLDRMPQQRLGFREDGRYDYI
jgi:hypothetical protein